MSYYGGWHRVRAAAWARRIVDDAQVGPTLIDPRDSGWQAGAPVDIRPELRRPETPKVFANRRTCIPCDVQTLEAHCWSCLQPFEGKVESPTEARHRHNHPPATGEATP